MKGARDRAQSCSGKGCEFEPWHGGAQIKVVMHQT